MYKTIGIHQNHRILPQLQLKNDQIMHENQENGIFDQISKIKRWLKTQLQTLINHSNPIETLKDSKVLKWRKGQITVQVAINLGLNCKRMECNWIFVALTKNQGDQID